MRIFKAIGGYLREKYMYHVCGIITLGLLVLGVFCFPNAVGRFVESCRDVGTSVAYTFCEWFDIDVEIKPTVNRYPNYDFLNVKDWFLSLFEKPVVPSVPSTPVIPSPPIDTPAPTPPATPSVPISSEWEQFKAGWSAYWKAFIDVSNIELYFLYIAYGLSWIAPVFMFILPVCVGIGKLLNKHYFKEPRKPETEEEQKDETRPIKESIFLRLWHWIWFKIIVRVLLWCISLVEFIKSHEDLRRFWFFLVLLYFNVFTIAIEFLAYYAYFMSSMDIINLYRQVYKLFLDLSAAFSFLPLICWCIVSYLTLDKYAKYVYWEQVEREGRQMEEFLARS